MTKTLTKTGLVISLVSSALIISACDKAPAPLPEPPGKQVRASAEEYCDSTKDLVWEKLPSPDPKFRSHTNKPLGKSFHMWSAKKRPKAKKLKALIMKSRKKPPAEASKRFAIGMSAAEHGGQRYALVDKQEKRVLALDG